MIFLGIWFLDLEGLAHQLPGGLTTWFALQYVLQKAYILRPDKRKLVNTRQHEWCAETRTTHAAPRATVQWKVDPAESLVRDPGPLRPQGWAVCFCDIIVCSRVFEFACFKLEFFPTCQRTCYDYL